MIRVMERLEYEWERTRSGKPHHYLLDPVSWDELWYESIDEQKLSEGTTRTYRFLEFGGVPVVRWDASQDGPYRTVFACAGETMISLAKEPDLEELWYRNLHVQKIAQKYTLAAFQSQQTGKAVVLELTRAELQLLETTRSSLLELLEEQATAFPESVPKSGSGKGS